MLNDNRLQQNCKLKINKLEVDNTENKIYIYTDKDTYIINNVGSKDCNVILFNSNKFITLDQAQELLIAIQDYVDTVNRVNKVVSNYSMSLVTSEYLSHIK